MIYILLLLTRYQVVACGSIIIERKFTRSGGIIGHIEDIAVSKSMQGRKLGLRVISTLEGIGRKMGCYKIILDCSKENIRELFRVLPKTAAHIVLAFYEKCGYKPKEREMVCLRPTVAPYLY